MFGQPMGGCSSSVIVFAAVLCIQDDSYSCNSVIKGNHLAYASQQRGNASLHIHRRQCKTPRAAHKDNKGDNMKEGATMHNEVQR